LLLGDVRGEKIDAVEGMVARNMAVIRLKCKLNWMVGIPSLNWEKSVGKEERITFSTDL